MFKKDIQGFYNEQGDLLGVYISARLWHKISTDVHPILERALKEISQAKAKKEDELDTSQEPLEDWENFLKFWDFRYPVEKKVICQCCGNQTENWQEDYPRKFILTAANLGGLVSFFCTKCKARVIKRHFKDKIVYETTPFVQRKK